MSIKPRGTLSRIQPYVPGRSVEDLMRDYGISDAVKLSSNENPLGASTAATAAIQKTAEEAHLYPDGSSIKLKQALARRFELPEDHFILGCGSDEIIRLLAEAYLEPKSPCLFADVTFSQYAFVARIMEAQEIVVPLKEGTHDLREMAYKARKHRVRLCFVCNPNNPTGTYVNAAEVARFLDAIPEDTLVVFDEAYIEYVKEPDFPDVLRLMQGRDNVVALRTFSKIYGLAGLRVGYGIASPRIVRELERIRPPFNVNRIAQAAALAALEDGDHCAASSRMNARERIRVGQGLEALGLKPLPSQANFIWVGLDRPSTPIYEAMLKQGVIVRDGAAFGVPTALRVSIGRPEDNERFLRVLTDVLETEQTERGSVG